MTGKRADIDQVSMIGEEKSTDGIFTKWMQYKESQGGQKVFLTWVSKGNTGDGAQVDAFAIGCSMQLAGKHQDEQYEPGPSHDCILGSHKT